MDLELLSPAPGTSVAEGSGGMWASIAPDLEAIVTAEQDPSPEVAMTFAALGSCRPRFTRSSRWKQNAICRRT